MCVCVCGCVCMRECVAVRDQHSHGWVWVSAMGAVTVGVFMCDMWLGGGGSVCVCVCVCVCVTCTWLVCLQAQGGSDHAHGAAHSRERAGLCVFEGHVLTVGAGPPVSQAHPISSPCVLPLGQRVRPLPSHDGAGSSAGVHVLGT